MRRVLRFMKPPFNLRLRLEYAGVRLAVALARAIPLQAASWLSGKLWRLIAPHLGRQKRALRNLAIAFPEKSVKQRQAIAAAMWENLGRTFAESFRLRTLVESGRIVFEPGEDFDRAAAGAKPFVVCGLHLGNWEILAHGGQRLGVSLIGVYQRVSNPYVDTLLRGLRAPLYKSGLMPKTPASARALVRAIKAGACPCFLADLRDDRGPRVAFFGKTARSNLFPAQLARRTGVPSTPAPPSAVPARASPSASPGCRWRIRTTTRPTLSRQQLRSSSSTKPSSAKRPSNGCGRMAGGTKGRRLRMESSLRGVIGRSEERPSFDGLWRRSNPENKGCSPIPGSRAPGSKWGLDKLSR